MKKNLNTHGAKRSVLYLFATLFTFGIFTTPILIHAGTYPEPKSFVTDTIGLLTSDQVLELESALQKFEQETSNEIAVLIVKTTAPETIEQYSIHVTDEWKIGKKDLDNGVLFLIAVEDRAMRLEVGQGLEGVLTDLTSTKLLDEFAKPYFRNGDYYTGIKNIIEKTAAIAKGEYSIETPPKPFEENYLENIPAIIAILVLPFILPPFILAVLRKRFPKIKYNYGGAVFMGFLGGMIAAIIGSMLMLIIFGIIAGTLLGSLLAKTGEGKSGRGWWRGGSDDDDNNTPFGGFWGGGSGDGSGGGGFGGFGGGGFSGGGGSSKW